MTDATVTGGVEEDDADAKIVGHLLIKMAETVEAQSDTIMLMQAQLDDANATIEELTSMTPYPPPRREATAKTGVTVRWARIPRPD